MLMYFVVLLAGGAVLGAVLAYCRPRDNDAAEVYRDGWAKAVAWLRHG